MISHFQDLLVGRLRKVEDKMVLGGRTTLSVKINPSFRKPSQESINRKNWKGYEWEGQEAILALNYNKSEIKGLTIIGGNNGGKLYSFVNGNTAYQLPLNGIVIGENTIEWIFKCIKHDSIIPYGTKVEGLIRRVE